MKLVDFLGMVNNEEIIMLYIDCDWVCMFPADHLPKEYSDYPIDKIGSGVSKFDDPILNVWAKSYGTIKI